MVSQKTYLEQDGSVPSWIGAVVAMLGITAASNNRHGDFNVGKEVCPFHSVCGFYLTSHSPFGDEVDC